VERCRSRSRESGGHLATIRNAGEQQWVFFNIQRVWRRDVDWINRPRTRCYVPVGQWRAIVIHQLGEDSQTTALVEWSFTGTCGQRAVGVRLPANGMITLTLTTFLASRCTGWRRFLTTTKLRGGKGVEFRAGDNLRSGVGNPFFRCRVQ